MTTFACIASFICGIGLGLYLAPQPRRNRRGQFVKQDGSYKPKHTKSLHSTSQDHQRIN